MARAIRNWLLRQLNSRNVMDGVTLTTKLAVEELGAKTVAGELRRVAKHLEKTGNVPGWKFPQPVKNRRQNRDAGDLTRPKQDAHSRGRVEPSTA